MDQDLLVPKQNSNKLLTKKTILIVFAIIIAAEAIWAYQAIIKTKSLAGDQAVAAKPKATTVSLTSVSNSVKVGQKIIVSVDLSSTRRVAGVDLIISYDPKFLSVDAGSKAQPVNVRTLFNEYPQNTLEATSGKIIVSGITSSPDGVLGNGTFGSIIFIAKAAGNTTVSTVFSPGETKDTNVIETKTGKDVLEKVNNLDITITK